MLNAQLARCQLQRFTLLGRRLQLTLRRLRDRLPGPQLYSRQQAT